MCVWWGVGRWIESEVRSMRLLTKCIEFMMCIVVRGGGGMGWGWRSVCNRLVTLSSELQEIQ